MRLSDQAAVMMIGRLAERGIGLLSGMALVRLLTKDEYGSFLQIGLVSQLAAAFLVFGLPHSLLTLVPRAEPRSRRQVILGTGRLMAGLALLGGAALTVSAPLLVRAFNNPALATLGFVIGIYTLFYSIDRMVEPALLALGEARRAGVLAAVTSCLLVAATLTPAWLGWGLAAMYGGMTIVTVAHLAYFGSIVGGLPGAVPGQPPAGFPLRPVLGFAVPMGLSALATQYNRVFDGLVVSFLFTPAKYAVYARGAFELPLIDLVPYTLANVILPKLAELWKNGDRRAFLELWGRLVRVSALCLIPAMVYSLLFAEEIIVTLFSVAYREAVPVFQVYLLSLPLRLTSFAILLQAVADSRAILNSTLWSLSLSLLLAPTLCHLIGPIGAAAAFVASQTLWTLLLRHAIGKRTQFALGELIPWAFVAKTAGVALAAGLIVRFLGGLAPAPLSRLLLTGPVFVLISLAGFLGLNLLDSPEKELLLGWFSRKRAGR